MHPWHDITPGEKLPAVVNAIIEIPRGTKAKYEVDKQSGLLKLDRVLYGAFHYPVNYGFIPQTMGADGDPLDILVISQADIEPLCLVLAKVIGLMQMTDQGISDEKVIAVAMGDGAVNHYNSVDDLPAHLKLEIKHFFEHYTRLENKKVEVHEFLPDLERTGL
ncbi:MAG: inorganic diphosphatase [Flavobacteriales bacterium]|nr:inorganic diphosphatase [Flavobacteriales bacterium]